MTLLAWLVLAQLVTPEGLAARCLGDGGCLDAAQLAAPIAMKRDAELQRCWVATNPKDDAAVTFVIAPAVHNLFVLAREIGLDSELRNALNDSVAAACVGPVCAEGALDEGVLHPVVPDRARLVPMVQSLTEHLAAARRPGSG